MASMAFIETEALGLAVALMVGLLLGAERGWTHRETRDGGRVAGLRTFGVIGLLGGVSGLLSSRLGGGVFGLVFLALAIILLAAHLVQSNEDRDRGVTSVAAALLVFALGGLSSVGEPGLAAAAAVVAALLMSYKTLLHGWLGNLESAELHAVLKLLLISVVVLPLLPDRGYGPWQALNPYAIWWMVVLIATISSAGYFAVQIGGARQGTLFTGLFGGLASSTAVTLQFARAARQEPASAPLLATAILLACGTMFPRMFLVASMLNPALLQPLLLPALAMALVVYLPALWFWRETRREKLALDSPLKNPFELGPALVFGALLAAVMLFGEALRHAFGDAGLLALSAASGITDVDAITLSLSRMSTSDVTVPVAVLGIVIAAATNTLAKAAMAAGVGGRAVGLRVAGVLSASAFTGLGVAVLGQA